MIKLISQFLNNLSTILEEASGDNPIHGTITHYDCKESYLNKRHWCYDCGNVLEKQRREVIVNSESEEAKNYNFHMVDTYYRGNIRFVSFYFKCSSCGKIYEVRDYINLEKMRAKERRKKK